MTHVVFTDLDGTLLDRNNYSWEAARPALERLRRDGVPWVFVTSKTRAEVEVWRRRLRNDHPFIVENGGAAFVPRGYFPFVIPAVTGHGDYQVIEWGAPYATLAAGLETARRLTGCRVNSFHEMTLEEAAAACNLPVEEAAWAQQRDYDEPFVILERERSGPLLAAIEAQGLRWTKGGRFHHVCGNNDKALAVTALRDLFQRFYGQVATIGLGDGLNDVPFLHVVDFPVIIHSPWSDELKPRIPHALVTNREGPEGWNQAVLTLLAR